MAKPVAVPHKKSEQFSLRLSRNKLIRPNLYFILCFRAMSSISYFDPFKSSTCLFYILSEMKSLRFLGRLYYLTEFMVRNWKKSNVYQNVLAKTIIINRLQFQCILFRSSLKIQQIGKCKRLNMPTLLCSGEERSVHTRKKSSKYTGSEATYIPTTTSYAATI